MRLEKRVRAHDVRFVGLLSIFVLILKAKEPTKGLQRTGLITFAFQ